MYIQDCSNKLLQKIVLSDCISINIRVSIRVRGLHLVSSPHPFPATPLRPRRPQPSAQFSAPISRPQPSAQPSSLIPSGFSPPISSHSLAPTPSAAVCAILPTHLPSAAVRAAKLAHPQRLLLPNHFALPCTHAVRSRPRSHARSSPAPSSPHPFPATPWHPCRPHPSAQFSPPICRPQPSAQPSSLITSGFFSPPISSHSVAPTPSAAVRAAELADLQRLLLPTHFQPLRCTHAVRSRPRNSPHPFAVRSRPRSQARSSPAASSPQPFPATLAPTPSAAVRAAKLADLQRLLFPLLPFPSFPFLSFPLHPRRPHTTVQTSSLPHAVKQLNENPSIEDAFGKKYL